MTSVYRTVAFAQQVQPRNGQILNLAYYPELRPAPTWIYRKYPQVARQSFGDTLWLDRDNNVFLAHVEECACDLCEEANTALRQDDETMENAQ